MLFKIEDTGACISFYVIQHARTYPEHGPQDGVSSVTLGCYAADMVSNKFWLEKYDRESGTPCDSVFEEDEFIKKAERNWDLWMYHYSQKHVRLTDTVRLILDIHGYQETPIRPKYIFGF